MAPELENYWFERVRKGRWCGTRTIAWQGRALTAVYSAVLALAAALLVERTKIGFVVALVLATAIYLSVVFAKTRSERKGLMFMMFHVGDRRLAWLLGLSALLAAAGLVLLAI